MATVRKRKWTHEGVEKTSWVVAYTDQEGKRRLLTKGSKKEAETARRRVEAEVETQTHTPYSQTVTVREACELFIRFNETRRADGRIGRTRENKLKNCCVVHIIPALGSILLPDLKLAKIETLYQELCRGGRLKPSSARDVLVNLKMVMDHAVKRELVRKHVVVDAIKELRGIPPSRVRTFTVDEIKAVLVASSAKWLYQRNDTLLRNQCFVNLAAFCGLRFGEIVGLRLEDVDLAKRVIHVRHSVTAYREIKGPKTAAGVRDIPMPPHVAVLLGEWLARYYVAKPHQRFLTGHNGEPVWYAHWQAQWVRVLKHAGLDGGESLHFHALRHFAASWMIENGISIMDTASLLGHSKFDTTLQVYAHPIAEHRLRHEAIDRMAQLVIAPQITLDATTSAQIPLNH